MALEFERRKQPVACILLHPGTVDTDLSKPFQRVGHRGGACVGVDAAHQAVPAILGASREQAAEHGRRTACSTQGRSSHIAPTPRCRMCRLRSCSRGSGQCASCCRSSTGPACKTPGDSTTGKGPRWSGERPWCGAVVCVLYLLLVPCLVPFCNCDQLACLLFCPDIRPCPFNVPTTWHPINHVHCQSFGLVLLACTAHLLCTRPPQLRPRQRAWRPHAPAPAPRLDSIPAAADPPP